ncbi:MAG: AraC family transcriptional regulator [Hyphomonadaceae bacterium]|nr:AraC family transcriptional regulator [Hyphomonadaceae bacterium]
MREFVEVSQEMTLVLGEGPVAGVPMPPCPFVLAFNVDTAAPTVTLTECGGQLPDGLVLVIERAAFERIGGASDDQCAFHLPSDLRAIVLAIRDSALSGETRKIYRLGKSIELLCETIGAQSSGELVPLAGESTLSLDDTSRIAAARRMIDERWNEKLTLDKIARACGVNRAKLTRGFRDMFNCTIAEAIAERRLSQAKLMLRTTDLPVSSVGYENGYLNNASFARAFSRRFGLSPSDFRACQGLAA